MKVDTITTTVLTASDGHYLTDGESYGKQVYLAIDRSPDEFYEITDEEYKEILDKQQEDFGIIEEE